MAGLKPFQLKKLLLTDGPERTFDSLFTTTIPVLFGDLGEFSGWKAKLAAATKHANTELYLCGSALFGFSLDPEKVWRPFSSSSQKHGYVSDLDLVVISETLFREAWDTILDAHRKLRLHLSAEDRRHMHQNLFKGFISDYHIPTSTVSFERVLSLRGASGTHVATTGFILNMRFYRTLTDYRWYQINSLAALST